VKLCAQLLLPGERAPHDPLRPFGLDQIKGFRGRQLIECLKCNSIQRIPEQNGVWMQRRFEKPSVFSSGGPGYQFPWIVLDSPILGLVLCWNVLAEGDADDIEMLWIAVIGQPDLGRGELAVFFPANGPDPLARIEPQTGDATFRVLLRVGQADEIDGRHTPISS
jgi:hypothetical protein